MSHMTIHDAIILFYYTDDFVTLERTVNFFNEKIVTLLEDKYSYSTKTNVAAVVGITNNPSPTESKRDVTIQEGVDAAGMIQQYSNLKVKHMISEVGADNWCTTSDVLQHVDDQLATHPIQTSDSKKKKGCILC